MRAQDADGQLPLIPYPAELTRGEGHFNFDDRTVIVDRAGFFGNETTAYLQELIREVAGFTPQQAAKAKGNYIEFIRDTAVEGEEAYRLDVSPERITVAASAGHGAFNALQTLRQLMPASADGAFALPAMKAADAPAYTWRGMHIDVSRHFYTLDYLKKHIDRLAYYKFNKLHIHLTDDQGWRIEIKKYPKLTEEGAWREFDRNDRACMARAAEDPTFTIDPRFITDKDGRTVYGGFYTQAQMRELITYAQQRHVELVPEVDMPGHMMAAIKAYPWLIDGEPAWGDVFSIPLAAYKPEVYDFCRDVLAEIIDLFPSRYIHIGGDEVEKKTWEQSDACHRFMQERGIDGVNRLQSYFIREMQKYVESRGRKAIAWDEVLDGGADPGITVMYWRGWVKDAAQRAVRGGNELIMTPNNPMYFDYANNDTSVSLVYHMDIVPKGVDAAQAQLVLGAQANLWAEAICNETRAELQMYPRMLALAERTWTDDTSDFDGFSRRLEAHYPRLDAMGVNYRMPDITGFAQRNLFVGETEFHVASPLPGNVVRYTLDGSLPTAASPAMDTPVRITEPVRLRMALFSPSGTCGQVYDLDFSPTEYAELLSAAGSSGGLQCGFFPGYFRDTKGMAGEPAETFTVESIEVPKEAASFGLRFDGYIDVPEAGIYSFFLTCDDGAMLYIGGRAVVDNDGQHSPVMKSGQAALSKGAHPFRLDFIEAGGGYTLKLQYSLNGSEPREIPAAWLSH